MPGTNCVKAPMYLYSSLHRSTTWLLRKTLSERLENTVLFFPHTISHYCFITHVWTCDKVKEKPEKCVEEQVDDFPQSSKHKGLMNGLTRLKLEIHRL